MPRIQNIHTPAELKNLAVNGNFDIWQELEGDVTTYNTAAAGGFAADVYRVSMSGATTKNCQYARTTSVPTIAQSGIASQYGVRFTMLSALPSLAANDYILPLEYRMEGMDYAEIHGKTATFGFWFSAPVTGTYSFALRNAALNRSYVTTFTATANTYEYKTITVPMDSSGTWNFDNTIGLHVFIAAAGGTTFQTSTLNAWQAGNFVVAQGSTAWANSTNNMLIAQFSITEGNLGLGAAGFQRAGTTLAGEYNIVRRYYRRTAQVPCVVANTNQFGMWIPYDTPMRSAPSVGLCRGTQLNVQGTNSYNVAAVPSFTVVGVAEALYASFTGFSTGALGQGFAMTAGVPLNNGTYIALDARL